MPDEHTDYDAMLTHISDARGLTIEPNHVQIAEMKRALDRYPRPAIKAGVNQFLLEDTRVTNRLPLPAELLPYVQAEARRIIAAARNAQPEAQCPTCDDTGWIVDTLEDHTSVAQRCSCQQRRTA